MHKAIAYIRVSTEKQANFGISLEIQEQKIREYCIRKQLNLVDVIIDKGVSGGISLRKRPEGSKITQAIESGVKHIVSVKLDRLFRNTIDALISIEIWQKDNVGLHLLDFAGAEVDTSTSAGKLMFTMVAGFAQMEKDLIRERTQSAMNHKKLKGERCGQIPFGYSVNNKMLVENPKRKPAIKCIKELHEMGKSSRFIATTIQSDYKITISHATVNKLIKGMLN